MQTLTKALERGSLISGKTYSISSAEELAELATIVNTGTDTTGMIFVLANDIDLQDWCDTNMATGGWNSIGTGSNPFKGTFDGNGYVIRNFKIRNWKKIKNTKL